MFRRASAAIAAVAVVLSGLTFGAAPASAAIASGSASISEATWAPASTPQVSVSWTENANQAATTTDDLSVEIGWGWNWQYKNPRSLGSPALTDGQFNSGTKTVTCPSLNVTFQSNGFASTSTALGGVRCGVSKSGGLASDPGQKVQILDGTGTLSFTATQQITVTFAAGTITAPSAGPASDTWRIISWGSTTTVRTVVPAADGTVPPPPPPVRLDFDGNGGTCSPGFVEGEQGTWGSALTADQCTNGSRRLAFFSTSRTAAAGATNVRPGGPIFFLEANRLYAIWAADPPSPVTDVAATPGLNSVKVTWKPPVSDGGDPIFDYCVQLRTQTNTLVFSLCSKPSEPLERTVNLPATNAKYTFSVVARNAAGSSEPVASAPVSPYDIKDVTASRKDILLGLGGTRVETGGAAPGLAGQALNVQFKVGREPNWTTVANAVKVNADSRFSWSRKFPASANRQVVDVRFTYGSDAVAGPYALARGREAGDLSAPRNIKVDNVVNRVSVTWDPPKFDGGAKITGYTLCAVPSRGGKTCRSESATEGMFWNLNTLQTYTITVAAKTAAREGPEAKSAKTVDPTEASIRSAARSFDELTADVRGAGFKKNSRFRVEIASTVPGVKPNSWAWDEVTSFREDQDSFINSLRIPLDASLRGERLMLRLITPTGTVYSRSIRP